MARRHYSPKDFFRHVPNALLARYFREKELFTDLDFEAMKETKPDALFDAWLGLGEQQRNPIDAQFREIFEISCPKGYQAIIDEIPWQLKATPEEITPLLETLSALPNHYHRAMLTFLDHPNCWKAVTRFYRADTLTYWRKRKGLGHQVAAVDKASLDQLSDQIGNYFHDTEGRGKNCVVEPYRRGELDYFFCFPEDHSQQSPEWKDGEFSNRPHNPAFEIVFVYSQTEGKLDLNFKGSKKAVEPLESMFTSTILKLEKLPPNPKDRRVYDLDLFSKKSFNFTFDPASGVKEVWVRKLRFSSRLIEGERITLEANDSENPKAIYELMETIGKSTPLHLYNITQVELAATVIVDADKTKDFPIRITHPNSCSLKYDELDLKLRDMLEASGVEPREPEEETENTEDLETAEA